jgi:hypothetical protein
VTLDPIRAPNGDHLFIDSNGNDDLSLWWGQQHRPRELITERQAGSAWPALVAVLSAAGLVESLRILADGMEVARNEALAEVERLRTLIRRRRNPVSETTCTEHKGHRRYIGGVLDGRTEHLVFAHPSDYSQTMGTVLRDGQRSWYELDYATSDGTEAVYRHVGDGRTWTDAVGGDTQP